MTSDKFAMVLEKQIEKCREVLVVKAGQYAKSEDVLHNFKVAAELLGVTDRAALAGMMAKHVVSVYDMCMSIKSYPADKWDEKITDTINYLILLQAVLDEDYNAF